MVWRSTGTLMKSDRRDDARKPVAADPRVRSVAPPTMMMGECLKTFWSKCGGDLKLAAFVMMVVCGTNAAATWAFEPTAGDCGSHAPGAIATVDGHSSCGASNAG